MGAHSNGLGICRLLTVAAAFAASVACRAGAQVKISDSGGPRELSAELAATVLGIPQDNLNQIIARKERVSKEAVGRFQQHFGRLPNNDVPTYQLAEGRYFVLIPLPELEKQPSPSDAAADVRDRCRRAPAKPHPEGAWQPPSTRTRK